MERISTKMEIPKCFRNADVYMLITHYAPVPTPALHCIPPLPGTPPHERRKAEHKRVNMAENETAAEDSGREKQARNTKQKATESESAER